MGAANVRQRQSDAVTDYRYKRFTTRLLLRDLRFRKDAAGPGDAFPSFELLTTNGDRLVNNDVFGHKPVLVIFGSMTCPMTAKHIRGNTSISLKPWRKNWSMLGH